MATLKDATDSVMSVAWSPVWSVEGQFAVGSADTKVYVYNDAGWGEDFVGRMWFPPNSSAFFSITTYNNFCQP